MSAAHAKERLMSVVLGPHMSEKATSGGDRDRQIVFRVRRDSTKDEIRHAVELLFEVKVAGVQVVNVQGKSKRFGRTIGRRQDWKKHTIRIEPALTIEPEVIDDGLGRLHEAVKAVAATL